MSRILILSHFYPPEMGGAAARLSGLARWLANFQHEVTVVTGLPNYPTGKVFPKYSKQRSRHEIIDGVNVVRSWIYASNYHSSMGRIFNYVSFMVSSIVTCLRLRRKYDILIASSPPLSIGISGWVLSKWLNIPWVLDIRDIWPEVAVEAGEFSATSPLVKLGHWIAMFLYGTATHITPVTLSKRDKLVSNGVNAEKITVVTNGIDLDIIQQSCRIDIQNNFGINEKYIIVYAGLIGVAQGIDIIIDGANTLRENSQFHFLIIGDGVQRNHHIRRTNELGLHNITFLPSQPKKKIFSILRSADAALVPLVSKNLSDAVPSKLLEAWGCNTPVILIAGGESADIVKQVNGGVVVQPGDKTRFVDVIKHIALDRKKFEQYARNGYNHVVQFYNREKLARELESVLGKILSHV